MLAELIEFDEAVGFALAWNAQRGNDTLIVATADHGHAYDVWGTVDTTGKGRPEWGLAGLAKLSIYRSCERSDAPARSSHLGMVLDRGE
jgi:alkaline phosphatase